MGSQPATSSAWGKRSACVLNALRAGTVSSCLSPGPPGLQAPDCHWLVACSSPPPTPATRVVHLRLQEPEAALPPLRKLHAVVPDNPEAIHCIALAHDMMGDTQVSSGAKGLRAGMTGRHPRVLVDSCAAWLAKAAAARAAWG